MFEIANLIPPRVINHLSEKEINYLNVIFTRFNGFPNLKQIWQLMDEVWIEYGCDPKKFDNRALSFYNHPIWLLNGLFIEQDSESINNRVAFADWVVKQSPIRIADFGGGFGGLARLIGHSNRNIEIDIVEPHPHPAVKSLISDTANIKYFSELNGKYDILIATDVFEHVEDPINLVATTSEYLRVGGYYLIANCFQPVVLCHLPQHFHLSISWDFIMRALGLEPREKIKYGRVYKRLGSLDIKSANKVIKTSKKLYFWIKYLPKGQVRIGKFILKIHFLTNY